MSRVSTLPPEPVRDDRLAEVFDARVVPGYWGPFARRLVESLSDRILGNARVLELGCATGTMTVELARVVPEGRIVAVDPRRTLLDRARDRAADLSGRRVFFKAEPPGRTSFADGAFDLVAANLPFDTDADPDAVLGEMRRVAAQGATVALTVTLAGTWSTVLDVYEEVVERFEFPGAAERLAAVRARHVEPEDATRRVLLAGIDEVACDEFSFPIRFRNARELFRDDLVAAGPLRDWKAVAGDDATWERAVFHLKGALDTYFASAEAIEVPVRGAVLIGRIGEGE